MKTGSNPSKTKLPFYTDLYKVYKNVIPKDLHRPPFQRGRTHAVERFNGTLHSKVSRSVGKNHSFANSLDTLSGFAVYIYHYWSSATPGFEIYA